MRRMMPIGRGPVGRWLAVLATVALSSTGPACAADRPPYPKDARTAAELIRRLDLTRPELDPVRRLAEQGDLGAALHAWRDLVVSRLRRLDFGQFGWHSYKPHPRPVTLAKYYAGIASPDALRKWHPKLVATDGAAARITEGNFEYPLPSFVYCYWHEADRVYPTRAFDLMADFCATNHEEFWRRFRDRIDGKPVPAEPRLAEWRLNVNALSCGWRWKNFMQTMAGFAKCLAADKPEQWGDILGPCLDPINREAAALIPSDRLATIAISGYEHHAARLLWFCLHPGAVPNQRSTGLKALAMLNLTFPGFRKAPQLAELLDRAYTELLDSNFLPDGGSLEQSFNYNQEDMRGLEEVAALYGHEGAPAFVEGMLSKAAARRLVSNGLRDPLGGLPQVGNSHGVAPRNIWSDAEAAQRYLASVNPGSTTAATAQPYLSKAFPYSGYYAIRDGWGLRDCYLFFMNGRPQRGHSMRDSLAIQMTAYGRPMLVCAGPPTYGMPRNDDARGAEFYLSEASSLKTNTVIVDGKSQAKNAPRMSRAPQTPVQSRFHTSAHFDLVDGRYALGYERPEKKDRQLDMAVEHDRTVVFVRAAKVWVVVDRMIRTDARGREFAQIWNFLPFVQGKGWADTLAGYRDDQFALDAEQRRFGTADPDGPNVDLLHFGPARVRYTKYVGDRERWLGWYARGIGDAIPAVDVHANWASADGDTLLTLIAPRDRQTASPIVSIRSLDSLRDGTAGFVANLPNGARLSMLAASKPQRLRLEEAQATGQALLVYARGGTRAGIVRNGHDVTIAGDRVLRSESDCFEFSDGPATEPRVVPILLPRVPSILPEPRPVLRMADHPAVMIEADLEGAVVRYTVDGRDPGPTSPSYQKPLRLSGVTTVKARYFKDGRALPLVATRHYRPCRHSLRAPDLVDGRGLEPGLRYCYAKRGRWSRLYDLMKEAEYRPLDTGLCDSIAARPRDRLTKGQSAMVFDGYLEIPRDGLYTFHVNARDGMFLFVYNPQTDLEIPAVARCSYRDHAGRGSAALKAGWHQMRITYKKSHDSDMLEIDVEGPGLARQPLPAAWFRRRRIEK